jgi:cysteine desulfurase
MVSKLLSEEWGNPSSIHRKGVDAKMILEQSRTIVASAIGANPSEVYFTSGGTEANNLAITGICLARSEVRSSLITSTLEHPSVTKTVRGLKRQGWNLQVFPLI